MSEICETCGGCCPDCTEQEHCQRCRYEAAAPEMVAALIGVLRAQGDGVLPEWCGPVVEVLCKAGVSI